MRGYDISQCSEFRRVLFCFQAEDGIRDWSVTGVQTCALPISSRRRHTRLVSDWSSDVCSSDLSASWASPSPVHQLIAPPGDTQPEEASQNRKVETAISEAWTPFVNANALMVAVLVKANGPA